MECRTFEMTLISASDLPHVRRLLQMKVYAEVSIQGQSNSEYKFTPTDEDREANPYWNFKINYVVLEKAVHHEGTILFIKLYSKRSLKDDKYVGQVKSGADLGRGWRRLKPSPWLPETMERRLKLPLLLGCRLPAAPTEEDEDDLIRNNLVLTLD